MDSVLGSIERLVSIRSVGLEVSSLSAICIIGDEALTTSTQCICRHCCHDRTCSGSGKRGEGATEHRARAYEEGMLVDHNT